MTRPRQYTQLPDIALNPELDAKMRAMTELADRDIAALTPRTASVSESDEVAGQ